MAGSHDNAMESYKRTFASVASFAASAMLFRSVIHEFIPHELQDYILSGINMLRSRSSPLHTIVIEATEGYASNQIFDAAKTYLASRIDTSVPRLRVSRVDDTKNILISMDEGQEMTDVFEGTEFKWQLLCKDNTESSKVDRSFELTFHKKHKEKALYFYLPFILAKAKSIKEENRTLMLHMNQWDSWESIDLHHPSTFDTLAMEPDVKRGVMDDLARFLKRKDYYKSIGKAWKRGYLLYGPPGTGKSSLVAAMANYLKFDIYDLELTAVDSNTHLRRLLIGMDNRSILVIEDIDCTIELQQRDVDEESNTPNSSSRDEKVTLSGLLNFVDGIWSTCGEERIIVFTTNYKERLDPALLRPGRMDVHVYMGYCSFNAFKVLASNYHAIDDHLLFPEIEELIREVEVTPAQVAEALMKSDETDVALGGLVEFLRERKKDVKGS
ncbi:AAA-ATPase At3g50940 [Typha angustifolia]|uniref:AAA-ATPase At3g50940 n=1 Tax=Typha angustifolia TaxID=59011 RepID=UPI003C2B72CE